MYSQVVAILHYLTDFYQQPVIKYDELAATKKEISANADSLETSPILHIRK